MKKFVLLSVLFVLSAFSVMADAITYDTPEEIIERTQRDMRHK